MPHKPITSETLSEALERFDDVLAFHYPTFNRRVSMDTMLPASIASKAADILIDGLPLSGIL